MLSPESSSLPPSVERLSVEEIAPTARRRSTENFRVVDAALRPPPDVPAPDDKRKISAAIEAAQMLAFALSARALLLLSILFGFVLACLASIHETQASLFVLIAWCVLAILPLVVLEILRRRSP